MFAINCGEPRFHWSSDRACSSNLPSKLSKKREFSSENNLPSQLQRDLVLENQSAVSIIIGGGLCSSMSLLSEKSVVEGASNSWKEFGIQMGLGAIAGCIGGAATASISLGASTIASQAIASGVSETIVNPLVGVASWAIGSDIDSVAYTVTNGLACGNFQKKQL